MKDNYEEKYGHIPDDQEDILKYIMENFKIDLDKLQENENHINTLRWENVSILLPVVPKPTPRPRYNPRSKNFYVKGASANKKLIEQFIDDNNIIYTRTKLIVTTYHPIPVSAMKPHEIYLAEKGLLCPTSDPDWDNLGKKAGFIRNSLLVEKSTYMIAFWDEISSGTIDSISKSKKFNRKTITIYTKRLK
jgi:hypothetical protein